MSTILRLELRFYPPDKRPVPCDKLEELAQLIHRRCMPEDIHVYGWHRLMDLPYQTAQYPFLEGSFDVPVADSDAPSNKPFAEFFDKSGERFDYLTDDIENTLLACTRQIFPGVAVDMDWYLDEQQLPLQGKEWPTSP